MSRRRAWEWLFSHVYRTGPILTPERPALPDGPFIIAANHLDWLDGLALMLGFRKLAPRRRLRFVSVAANYRVFGDYNLKIDHNDPASVLKAAEQTLAANSIVVFFIEGERNSGSQLLPGKTGCVRLALATGLPIVPVGLIGPSFPSFFISLPRFSKTLPRLRLNFGAPITFGQADPSALDRALLHEKTRVILKALAPLCGKSIPDNL